MKQAESKTTLEQFTVVKRGVIYARVSTDEQAETGTSIDHQVEKSLKYAEALGIHVPPEFIFKEDYTGKVLDRPELNKVRALLKAGAADSLIGFKPNRLDRSEWGVNLLILLQELKALGVELHYSEARRQIDLLNPIEALMQSISGWQSGEDHRETVTKLYNGRINKAKDQGSATGSDLYPYGYELEIEKDGKRRIRKLVIFEPEAQVVRLIFRWYVVGDETKKRLSIHGIANKLNELNIPTRSATNKRFMKRDVPAVWGASSISAILRNETYAGTWHYAKRSKLGTQPAPVEVPAIIETQLFQAAQEQLKLNARYSRRNRKSGRYLLAQRITCGHCGYKMCGSCSTVKGKQYKYYRCPSYQPKAYRRKCDLPHFVVEKIDNLVWGWLDEMAHDGDKLEKGLRGYQAATQAKADPIQEELTHVEALLVQYNEEWEEAIANMEAVSSKRAKAKYALDVERIEGTLDELENRKKDLSSQLNRESITDEQIIHIKAFMAMIAADWEEISRDFNGKQTLLEWLDIQARIVVEEGQQVVYVRGKITAGEVPLLVATNVSRYDGTNQQTFFVIEARLVLQ